MSDLKKIRESGHFDADWYLKTYPDVAALGMDPAEHYLKYGADMLRDPGPTFSTRFYRDTHPGKWRVETNPLIDLQERLHGRLNPETRSVLWAAYNVAQTGTLDLAIDLASAHAPPEHAHTINILKANRAILSGSEQKWLSYLNRYLSYSKLAPLILTDGRALFERFATSPLQQMTDGPLISVLMPAWNAETTVKMAATSILAQTWRNLELIIVNDCSSDNTNIILQDIAEQDSRVRLLHNKANVGPYVSKNLALQQARGKWITSHDADDWAHPQRLERHYAAGHQSRASVADMLRLMPNGMFGQFTKLGEFSRDGVARRASISCLFEADFLRNTLGYWDSVRYGADSEMISRARAVLGSEFHDLDELGMLCLDLETSLTNDPLTGIKTATGLSDSRRTYKRSWAAFHKALSPTNAYLEFPQKARRYQAADKMIVSETDILKAATGYCE